jgi:hypothetical protein
MSYEDYLTMTQQGVWAGGWVVLQSGTTAYITAGHSIEQSNENGSLGCFYNPFSETAYNEMMSAHTWPGGHVQYGDGVRYRRSYNEQMGSCDGSMLCSGSGPCYVQTGHEDIATAHNEKVRISLSWSSGYTNMFPYSFLNIHPHVALPFKLKSNSLAAEWRKGYSVLITGSLEYTEGDSKTVQVLRRSSYAIPDLYRGEPQG